MLDCLIKNNHGAVLLKEWPIFTTSLMDGKSYFTMHTYSIHYSTKRMRVKEGCHQ